MTPFLRLICAGLLIDSFRFVHATLFKTKEIEIQGNFGDYYLITANAEDPFQSLEVNLVCSILSKTVFSAKIQTCVPEVDVDEWWHFHYNCELDVSSDDWDGSASKRNVIRADPSFAYRRRFVLSISSEEGKYVLWNGDRRKPFKKDHLQRYFSKAEVTSNESACQPDRLVIRGTVWNVQFFYMPGPETTTTTTTTTVTTTEMTSTISEEETTPIDRSKEELKEGSGIIESSALTQSITPNLGAIDPNTPSMSSLETPEQMLPLDVNPFIPPTDTQMDGQVGADLGVILDMSTQQPIPVQADPMFTETAGLVQNLPEKVETLGENLEILRSTSPPPLEPILEFSTEIPKINEEMKNDPPTTETPQSSIIF